MLIGFSALTYSCSNDKNAGMAPDKVTNVRLQRILFVGDSFTHGRYAPVRMYNSGSNGNSTTGSKYVVDENYGQTGARKELENGPWGGIPGIFAELAEESGLSYDVHIEAISETSLEKNYAAAAGVIAQSKWNAVVLQELSVRILGGQEKAAVQLGISSTIASQLQLVAWQTVTQENTQRINQSADPCTIRTGA